MSPSEKPGENPKIDGRRLRGSATRAAAIKAAAELFASQGYSATGINSIAKAAGANAASIYHAFGSKEGLLAAVVDHASNEFFEQLDVLTGQPTPAQALRRLADSFESNPLFIRLLLILILERGDEDPALLQTAVDVRERGRAVIAEAMTNHLPDLPEARRGQILDDLSRLLMVLMDGAFIARQVDADAAVFRRIFDLMAAAMRGMVSELSPEEGTA
ncbi:TetR/AcrR family transcriptional regulator [Actinocorallia sp. API 0066]|uniref:TetR/AcrR family transcriptional regulator n=1 Tax=Actinocorallia sp. API 0066 TaxID=2896846 RepID=UPI001E649503|nr:TetR/AcrR family transcriptional regulator [Actinocorallia sp. API 0066]MCD0447983.1 TetR/AcrR family transcriptional regulator [Actinocorallia sp. API 0066]